MDSQQPQIDLAASEKQYRLLFNNSQDAIYVFELLEDGHFSPFIQVNHTACQRLGYDKAELLQRTPLDIKAPESLAQIPAVRKKLQAAGHVLFEALHVTQDGRKIPVEINAHLFELEGRPTVMSVVRDVSARKAAEQALRHSEARFRLLAENAQDIIYRIQIQPTRKFEYVSPAVTAITGYTPKEHYADPDLGFKLVHPQDQPLLEATARADADPEAPLVLRWVRKDGTVIWTEQRNVPIFDEAGNLVAIEGIARDITGRKQAELELQRVNQALRMISECNQALVRATQESSLLREICQLVSEFGEYPLVWTGLIQDEGQALQLAAQARSGQDTRDALPFTARGKQKSHTLAGDAIRADTLRFAQYDKTDFQDGDWPEMIPPNALTSVALPLRAQGQRLGALNIYSIAPHPFEPAKVKLLTELADDLAYGIMALRTHAEREQAREKLETLEQIVDQSPAIAFLWKAAPGWPVRFVSDNVQQQLGYTPQDFYAQRIRFGDLIHPQDRDKVATEVAQYTRQGRTQFDQVYRILTKAGQVRWVDDHTWVRRDAGQVTHYQGIVLDVTARVQAEEKLAQQARALARSKAELERFTYVASHHLQEPLRMVSNYTQLLQKRYGERLDQDAQEFIAYAVDGTRNMQQMLDDIRAYLQLDRQNLTFQPTNCEQLLKDTLTHFREQIRQSAAVVTHDALPTVMGNPAQLSQVFRHLVDNALKFQSKAPPRIHISAEQNEQETRFSVQDNGIGIADQYLTQIFHVFQRLHSQQEYPGTGIGLAIFKKIVECHNGRVWVESEPGKGSTFYFALPKEVNSDCSS